MDKIGIMGALPEETARIVEVLQNPQNEVYAGVTYYTGLYKGKQLVVCCGGMGKCNAASTAQVLITRFEVQAVLFSGIAGNMSTQIGIGDIVISDTLLQHDADHRMLAQSAPGTAVYTADRHLIETAQAACRSLNIRQVTGRIATGDLFVGDAQTKQAIREKYNPACVEMEGAAVAQTCMRNEVPFVVLRAMSDNCEESIESLGAEEFNVDEYVKTSTSIVLHMIAGI